MRADDLHIQHGGEEQHDQAEDERVVKAGYFRDEPAEEHGRADAHVPRDEVGGVGRAAPGGFGKVDEQGLVGGRHHPEAEPEGHGGTEEHGFRGHEEEEQGGQQDGTLAAEDEAADVALVDHAAREKAAEDEPEGHEQEEVAGVRHDMALPGEDGQVVDEQPVHEGHEHQPDEGIGAFFQEKAIQRDFFAAAGGHALLFDQQAEQDAARRAAHRGDEHGVV